MPSVQTHLITPQTELSSFDSTQIYCALDSMVTLEVYSQVSQTYGQPAIYAFERALQAPYLEIMQRGFRVDETGRRAAIDQLNSRIGLLQTQLDKLAQAIWGKPLNPRSPKQLIEFFYQHLRVPEVWISQRGVRKLSTNREALEKIEVYPQALAFVQRISLLRDLSKQRSVLETEIDPDHRLRTSYNIAGTETGRPSSSTNAFGTGTNLQNIAPGLRWVFESDPGWKLGSVDLAQVEARDVGWICGVLFGDWSFLDACESGDLHTENARRIWPELKWGTSLKSNRAIADQIFYRDFSYRDMAKRGSHLSNYMGTAWTAARSLKVPLGVMEDFQRRYCRGPDCAFPAIPRYWSWVARELQTSQRLITPFGRERWFFGRPSDDSTVREGIAYLPQSMTADRMNLGLWRVWKGLPRVQLLAQTFDSLTFQFEDLGPSYETQVMESVMELIKVTLKDPKSGRIYWVPGDGKVGWNWGNQSPKNPDGLIKWTPGLIDSRQPHRGLHRIIV